MLTDLRERGMEGEKERKNDVREKHLPLICTPNGDRNWNLGTLPDQESNPRPFGVWNDALINLATLARAPSPAF